MVSAVTNGAEGMVVNVVTDRARVSLSQSVLSQLVLQDTDPEQGGAHKTCTSSSPSLYSSAQTVISDRIGSTNPRRLDAVNWFINHTYSIDDRPSRKSHMSISRLTSKNHFLQLTDQSATKVLTMCYSVETQ